ncbi:hypothetical protein F3Y22_tig00111941pilonHSYRG00192 [Hibiscus syriacus]|uniref:HTH myb-type domain-containing protein n=1 Tax=Hibiscus syriacus TaxID=106335 RepID=A0A6A2X8K9_HIBSY|nr:protein ROOT HAIR DEFECTIVE 3 homolog 1-like [Hibiscus syriacus]KAE8671723.1 hypothetical protein F3Y22_tig00111941pilonHSYRG00192 [Hibiscus syriacus]
MPPRPRFKTLALKAFSNDKSHQLITGDDALAPNWNELLVDNVTNLEPKTAYRVAKPCATVPAQNQQLPSPSVESQSVANSSSSENNAPAKSRMRWTPELHEAFAEAVNQLGGSEKATPKGVLKLMKVEGLTIYHIKSHLQIWKVIKENKDLDLPAHKVMVATVRCEEIANEKLFRLSSDADWLALEEAVQSRSVSGFGRKLSTILETHFSEYDSEAIYFDEGVTNAKRKQLESKALDVSSVCFYHFDAYFVSKA